MLALRFLRLSVLVGALIALLGMVVPAQAPGMVGQALKVCVLRDTGGMNPAELIRHPERFDCRTPQYRLGPGNFWVISRDIEQRSRPSDPLSVRFASLWQQGLALHALYADGRMTTQRTDARGITPWVQLGAVAEMPIARREAKVVRLLWHVEGSANMRGVMLGPRLVTGAESQRANIALTGLYAGFGGLCLALFVYNLALWGALRHRFQLFYCVMALGLLGYVFSSSGGLAWAFPDIANNDRLRLNYLLLGFTGASALIFARSFFEEQVFAGWLGRFVYVVAGALLGVGLLVFCFAPLNVQIVDAAFSTVFLMLGAVVAPMLWRAWRVRSNYLWLFAIGWGAPILTSLMRTLANFHVLQWSFWLDNSTLLSMALEALMSSLAIAYRIKLLRDERDDAIASEVMARRLADTDPLTGLLNRRAFLAQAIGRPGEQLLLIADIDHFKRVNETLGHDGGDEVLRLLARTLRQSAPLGALVARLGGEEFAILAPADAGVEPEQLLARLRTTRMPFDLKVTASIGACTGPLTSDIDWKTLYRGADIALFEAKSAGRDRARSAHREAA
jgi:diguanylate cyclase (GGDEF)-like protein